MAGKNIRLGELLLYSNKITKQQLDEALEKQKSTGEKLGRVLVRKGYVTDGDIIEVLEFQLGIPHVDLDKYIIDPQVVLRIPENIARRYEALAIEAKENYILVAMTDPLNIFAIDDIQMFTKSNIQVAISSREAILRNIDRFYRRESTEKVLKEFRESYELENMEGLEENELLEVSTAPIVKLINSLVQQAIDMRSSDIHIEPGDEKIRIRFRIDGDLHEITSLSMNSLSPIITRIKIMGKMNIAERRVPQDGRVETRINGREIDIRISTIPTVYGEKVVLRILDRSNFMFSKNELGFTQRNLEAFDKILQQPYGMILVTGPTGSGKTTTLYAVLSELNEINRNIITIEDPVEYKLQGINQIQINPKAGLSFATGLRSILRQDPDVIMVGEIRDSETAQISVRAAITGHLVLSTLHTNDSVSSVIRLVDMGVEPYLVSSAVIGVVSQRLIKELCPDCKQAYEATYSEKSLLGLDTGENITLYQAKGCNRCNSGFKGRRAVHEVLIVDEDIRQLIDEGKNIDSLRTIAEKQGMVSLFKNSINLAVEGITTVEEALRAGYTLS